MFVFQSYCHLLQTDYTKAVAWFIMAHDSWFLLGGDFLLVATFCFLATRQFQRVQGTFASESIGKSNGFATYFAHMDKRSLQSYLCWSWKRWLVFCTCIYSDRHCNVQLFDRNDKILLVVSSGIQLVYFSEDESPHQWMRCGWESFQVDCQGYQVIPDLLKLYDTILGMFWIWRDMVTSMVFCFGIL